MKTITSISNYLIEDISILVDSSNFIANIAISNHKTNISPVERKAFSIL